MLGWRELLLGLEILCLIQFVLGDPLTVVAHLSYHYFMRWFLFTTNSNPSMVVSCGNQIRVSMEGIEMATRTLGIMKQDSTAHAVWTALKRDVLQQLQESQNMASVQNRAVMVNSMLGCASEILEQLKRSTPPVCISMFFYMHLTKMIMMVTSAGQVMSREDASKYIQTSFDLPMQRFSTTYTESIDKVRSFCLKMQDSELTPEEMMKLNELVSWQANEFLEHFKSLPEPSPESGLPRCANAPLSSMSSQLSMVLTGDSSKSSSSDTGGFTMNSFPGVGNSSSGRRGGGGGERQGSEPLDQTEAQDLQMALQMQMEDLTDKVPPQSAEQLQMMMSHTEAAFEQARDAPAPTGSSVPPDSTDDQGFRGGPTSGLAVPTRMQQTKNLPDYRSLAPVVSNDPDEDAALDRDLYNSDGELDITEKDDCETEKEKKKGKSDERDVEAVSSPVKVASVPASTTPSQLLQSSLPQQQDVSILPQPRIADTTTPPQQQRPAETPTPPQQQQPKQKAQPLQPQPTAEGIQEDKGSEQERRRELSKAAQAALARLERSQQQKESPRPQQKSVSPKTQQKTPVQVNEHQSTTTPSQPTQHAGTPANSSDKQPAKPPSETPQSEPSSVNRVPRSSPSISTPDKPTEQGPALSQTPIWQRAHIRPTEIPSSSSPVTPLGVQPVARPTDQPQTQRPDSQLAVKPLPQSPVPSTVIPAAKPLTQSTQKSNQTLQATPPVTQPSAALTPLAVGPSLGVSSPALPLSTGQPQRTSGSTTPASSAAGNRVHVTIANPRPRQAIRSRPSGR